MRRILSTMCVFVICMSIHAQIPQKMSYQSILRNNGGSLIRNQEVGVRISILQGSSTGDLVYQEVFAGGTGTNENGLISLEIGTGTPVIGVFSDIDWSLGQYYLKSEIDPDGGTAYSIEGSSQLLSVPYALHAESSENAFSGDYNDLTNTPALFDGAWGSLTGVPNFATVATSGSYNDLSDRPSIPGTLWNPSGANIYYNAGRVGIGTTDPATSLHVYGSPVTSRGQLSLTAPSGQDIFLSFYEQSTFKSYLWYDVSDEDLRLQNFTSGELNLQPYGGRVGIGTNAPRATLEVNGQIMITGGTPAAGQVLTSDGNGLATWEPPAAATEDYICFEVKRDAVYAWPVNASVQQVDFSSNSTVWRNDGAAFNASTSTFTAPENGIYAFHGVIDFRNLTPGSLIYAFIRIGGGTRNYHGAHSYASNNIEGSEVSMTLYLSAGQSVQLWGYVNTGTPPAQLYGNTVTTYAFTYFTGAKIN